MSANRGRVCRGPRLSAFSLLVAPALTVAALLLTAGCSSVVDTGSGELAGVVGAAAADALTTNPGVAAGIGLGAQAGARASVQSAQRHVHRVAQDEIARRAGPLKVGQV